MVPDTVWILGVVESINKRNFFIKRVENRQYTTLGSVLENFIQLGSILFSDGYPSYPAVASALNLNHRVVNHTEGFVNELGEHTNNIESFWSDLKATMRKENGVKRSNIDMWIEEYTFKRRFLMDLTQEDFSYLFVELLKIIFN
ncbi:hypothetical protein DMUE_6231, partial [Dictyocoela muelleri]